MDIVIENLKEYDLEQFKSLDELCFKVVDDLEMIKNNYKKNISNPNIIMICAKEQNRLIGYAQCDIVYSLIREPIGYLWGLCVHPDYREKGIGTKLLAVAEEKAKEKGCKAIHFTSDPKRIEAHSLYEKSGYSYKETHYYKKEV